MNQQEYDEFHYKVQAVLSNDGYTIVKTLGEGSFGKVFCVVNKNNVYRAIKVLTTDIIEDIQRFRREIDIVKKIESKFVLKGGDLQKRSGLYYYEMPYIHAGSLREWADKGVEPKTAILCGLFVSHVLKELHAKNGFHRDIKPDNILLSKTKEGFICYLSDFGLARLPQKHGSNLTNSPIGTSTYFAPEISNGQNFKPSADIYALGITLLELITASPKRTQKNLNQVKEQHQNIGVLINEMTEEFPENRPSAQEVYDNIIKITKEIIEKEKTEKAIKDIFQLLVAGAVGCGALYLVASLLSEPKNKESRKPMAYHQQNPQAENHEQDQTTAKQPSQPKEKPT